MKNLFTTFLKKLGIEPSEKTIHKIKNQQTVTLLEIEKQAKEALDASKKSVKESKKTLQLIKDKTYEIALATGAIKAEEARQ